MTMKKRFLSLVLAAGVAAAALPIGALAAEEPNEIEIELPPVQFEELSRLPGSLVETEDETAAPSAESVPDRQGTDQSAPAQETSPDGRLKIRVKSMGVEEQILLYQNAVTFDRKKMQEAAWVNQLFLEAIQNGKENPYLLDPTVPNSESSEDRRAPGENGPALTQETLFYFYLVGIMEGGDGSFQLDRPITQGEFVKMTAMALGQYPENLERGASWAVPFVKKAISIGWVTDKLEEFDYDKTVSWQEAQAMLARVLRREDVTGLDLARGADVEFADQPLFRNQAAVIICNLVVLLEGPRAL